MTQNMVETKGRDKIDVLREVLQINRFKKTMIFCNTLDSVRAISHALSEVCLSNGSLVRAANVACHVQSRHGRATW